MSRALRQELWSKATEAFGHLGDAAPAAEAFIRHNAHDCVAAHHEKDYRVVQLFGHTFMQGKALVVLRIASRGTLEVDVVRARERSPSEGGAVTIQILMMTSTHSDLEVDW